MFVQVVLFGLTFWLGLYLLVRNYGAARVRWTGYGLVAYAIGLGFLSIRAADGVDAWAWERMARLIAILPAVLWGGALLTFLPADTAIAQTWARAWRYGIAPLAMLAALLGPWAPSGFLMVISIGPLLGLVVTLIWPLREDAGANRNPVRLALLVTIFLALATWMVLATVGLIGVDAWWYVAMGGDLLILGYLIATLDAWEYGERLWPDMLRSVDAAVLKSVLIGGPVATVMIWATGQTAAMVLLLYVMVGMAIAMQELDGPLEDALDRAAFATMPWLRAVRRDLRETATALPKVDRDLDLTDMSQEEFVRLTRRALSHLGNLPKLASSPLTNLEVVRRTVATDGEDHTLARAAVLKQILTESILYLKPPADAEFGTSDEWRYYNALYFPYVVGLKPFSRRADHGDVDGVEREALAWFRAQVPERTLYNWQNAAAELVAQHVAELDASTRNGD